MNNYEINDETLAIIPKNNKITIVYEKYNCFIINQNIKDIINNSCKYYGSTFEGRKVASSSILKVNYKVPILIEESNPAPDSQPARVHHAARPIAACPIAARTQPAALDRPAQRFLDKTK